MARLRIVGVNDVERVFYGDSGAPEEWCPVAPNELHLWAFLQESRSHNPQHDVRLFFCQHCLQIVEKRR